LTRSAAELTALAIVTAGLGDGVPSSPGPGPGPSLTWPVYTGRQPDSDPAEVITTYDTGGRDPLQLEEGLRRPTVQVRVRSAQYTDGWQKANAIYETLGTTYGEIYGVDRVVGFAARGDVLYVGRDSKDRCLFTINFELTRDMSQ
jgi:hypothetical protein